MIHQMRLSVVVVALGMFPIRGNVVPDFLAKLEECMLWLSASKQTWSIAQFPRTGSMVVVKHKVRLEPRGHFVDGSRGRHITKRQARRAVKVHCMCAKGLHVLFVVIPECADLAIWK